MVSFLDSGPVRAGVFFLAGFALSLLLGTLLGVPRLGIRVGVLAGLVLAAFGWVFVRPVASGD